MNKILHRGIRVNSDIDLAIVKARLSTHEGTGAGRKKIVEPQINADGHRLGEEIFLS